MVKRGCLKRAAFFVEVSAFEGCVQFFMNKWTGGGNVFRLPQMIHQSNARMLQNTL